jgi:polyphosphate glucokinase
VKLLVSGSTEPRRFESGKQLTPDELVRQVKDLTRDWHYHAISIGYPGSTGPNGPTGEAGNLGTGWVGYDFAAAFDRPVRIVNDAAMQALGGYSGGRMLFLGLGTGLGSALIADRVIISLELGCLGYGPSETMADRLGKDGLARYGRASWIRAVREVSLVLQRAFAADYIVLGGGNAPLVEPLPPGASRGDNEDAFAGGFRLWEEDVEHHDRPPSNVWRVVW